VLKNGGDRRIVVDDKNSQRLSGAIAQWHALGAFVESRNN